MKPFVLNIWLLLSFSIGFTEGADSFGAVVEIHEGSSTCSSDFNYRAATPIVRKENQDKDTSSLGTNSPTAPAALAHKSFYLLQKKTDTTKLVPASDFSQANSLNKLVTKNSFTKSLLKYFVASPQTQLVQPGVKSIDYFNQFSGKRIASIRFIRLHPFGTSLPDTTRDATKWVDKMGNHLHMNSAKVKLRMQLQFHTGEMVDPSLMAENEKLMRDLSFLEDVAITLEPIENNDEEVNVVVISKDKFEYAISMNISADNSDIEVSNVNMFGLGHRLNIGMAQKNAYLPEMGVYASYQINNIFGNFINSTIGFTDTYLKKGWNAQIEKKFLTSREVNAGGYSFENVSKYNYIAEDHPVKLDTTVAYITSDLWFLHAFTSQRNQLNKTVFSFRYYHQQYHQTTDDGLGQREFLRNHDFFLTSIGFSKRNLYKNNLVYGYGVTEDIPYGHYYELTTGLDRSQFGVWPYLNISFSKANVDRHGNYFAGRIGMDGFLDNGIVKQATIMANANYFSKKFFLFGDPCRQFFKVEFLSGIHRMEEEYLTIDGKFGIRDFYTNDLKGKDRLRINLETVRFLKGNFYGFKFTNYIFTDFAFLSDNLANILKSDFYAGIGAGIRIYNESLLFKIIDVRLTWFPIIPPEQISPFAVNLQGVSRSRFDDFLGRRPEVIRFQ